MSNEGNYKRADQAKFEKDKVRFEPAKSQSARTRKCYYIVR